MSIQDQIQALIQTKFVGKQVDTSDVVDSLLLLVDEAGQIRCTLAGPDGLRFEICGQEPCEVYVDLAKPKLRAMCARLGALCMESGQDVSLYGGEGSFEKELQPVAYAGHRMSNNSGVGGNSGQPGALTRGLDHPRNDRPLRSTGRWKVQFKNTLAEHEFTITSSER